MALRVLRQWVKPIAVFALFCSLLPIGPAVLRAAAAGDGDPLAMEFVAPAWFPATDATPGRWSIYLDGRIDQGAAERFQDELSRRDIAAADIYINSGGGAVFPALAIGHMIRRLGFATYVGKQPANGTAARPGDCFSACVFVLIGGQYRFAVSQSRIGVHRFSSTSPVDADPDNVQLVSAGLINYIKAMGVDVALFDRMSRAGKDQILLLTKDDVAQLGVLNFGRLPAEWEVEPSAGVVYLKATQQTRWGTGKIVLSCKDGQVLFEPGYEAGDKAAEIADSAVEYFIRTGERLDPLGEPLNRTLRSEGGYVSGAFALTPEQARILQNARSVGYAMRLQRSNEQVGFTVDAGGGATQKIKNILAGCS